MIDDPLCNLILLREVPKLLPKNRKGKRVHISTVHRWASRGVQGGVRLPTVKIGGATYTSLRALQEFSQRLSQPASSNHNVTPAPPRRNGANDQRRAERRQAVKKILG